MLQQCFDALSENDLNLLKQLVAGVSPSDQVSEATLLLLKGYLAGHEKDYVTSIELTNRASALLPHTLSLDDLKLHPHSGIRGAERVFVSTNWSLALGGQGKVDEALERSARGLEEWSHYQRFVQGYLATPPAPFILTLPLKLIMARVNASVHLHDRSGALRELDAYEKMKASLVSFSEELGETHLSRLRVLLTPLDEKIDVLREHLHRTRRRRKEEMLDLLVPDGFSPRQNKRKLNGITASEPLISVCIGSYKDGEWLKTTVDAVLAHAGYANFEIVVALQKLSSTDTTGEFLQRREYQLPNIKVLHYDYLLGCEGAKDAAVAASAGEIICALDAHVVPSRGFLKKIAKVFATYPLVSVIGFGLTYTDENKLLGETYYDEVPLHLNGVVDHKIVSTSLPHHHYKDDLYIRHALMGAGYVITRSCYDEIFANKLLPNHGWGDKLLGMNAFLYGYEVFFHPAITAIHKWHADNTDFWRESHRKTDRFEYTIQVAANALRVGYCYFSEEYFEYYFIPWIQRLTQDNFGLQFKLFHDDLPRLDEYKRKFWNGAQRSIREYWMSYWNVILPLLSEEEKERLLAPIQPDSI